MLAVLRSRLHFIPTRLFASIPLNEIWITLFVRCEKLWKYSLFRPLFHFSRRGKTGLINVKQLKKNIL